MDFHFHVFLEWMYVRREAEESDLHEGETENRGRAYLTYDRMTPRQKCIMHDHFWPDIDEALNALYPEFWQSWSQSQTPHFFSTNDSLGLSVGERQPSGPHSQIKWQSNFLSTDYFDCSCCNLTYYLIVVKDTSTSHA